jgi:hypothetical protein
LIDLVLRTADLAADGLVSGDVVKEDIGQPEARISPRRRSGPGPG